MDLSKVSSKTLAAIGFLSVGLLASSAEAAGPFSYFPITPCRVADTRITPNGQNAGPILSAGVDRNFTVKGVCGVPAGATAVSLNITGVGPTQNGFFVVFPAGGTPPVVSTLNLNAGEPALANGAIVPLAVATPNDLTITYGTAGGGTSHCIVDVTGYFSP